MLLRDLAAAFDDLALHGNQQKKRSVLKSLLRRIRSPREAAYLLKILTGDLRTGVQDGILIDAIAQAFEATPKDVRAALLLEGDLGNVAVLARHNKLSEARFALFRPSSFMLASVVEDETAAIKQIEGRRFIAEDKLDGIRAQIHLQVRQAGGAPKIAIYTRTLDNITESFPDIVTQLRDALAHPPAQSHTGSAIADHPPATSPPSNDTPPISYILDGEIVPWRNNRPLPFAHIQKRLGRKKPPAKVIADNPARFIAFDLLYADGAPLLNEPLEFRKARLATLGIPTLSSTPITTPDEIRALFAFAREQANEGLMLKDLASPYSPGRRGQVWYKLKTHLPTLDCVVTAAEHGHGKRRNHLSDYTFAVWTHAPVTPNGVATSVATKNSDDPTLVNIGKAYSGVTDAEIAELTALFQAISLSFDGRVHQVKPQVVLEIAFDAIQRSDRHASGFALRFPRIKTIRRDKPPGEADTLATVEQIHNSPANLNRVDDTPLEVTPPPQEPSLFDGL